MRKLNVIKKEIKSLYFKGVIPNEKHLALSVVNHFNENIPENLNEVIVELQKELLPDFKLQEEYENIERKIQYFKLKEGKTKKINKESNHRNIKEEAFVFYKNSTENVNFSKHKNNFSYDKIIFENDKLLQKVIVEYKILDNVIFNCKENFIQTVNISYQHFLVTYNKIERKEEVTYFSNEINEFYIDSEIRDILSTINGQIPCFTNKFIYNYLDTLNAFKNEESEFFVEADIKDYAELMYRFEEHENVVDFTSIEFNEDYDNLVSVEVNFLSNGKVEVQLLDYFSWHENQAKVVLKTINFDNKREFSHSIYNNTETLPFNYKINGKTLINFKESDSLGQKDLFLKDI